MVRHAPPGSALSRDLHGEYALWGPGEYLLALLADLMQASNWQRASSGRKSPLPKPKPIPRPTDKATKRLSAADLESNRWQSGVIGEPVELDLMKEWLRAKNGR